jgi:hypothetical protein
VLNAPVRKFGECSAMDFTGGNSLKVEKLVIGCFLQTLDALLVFSFKDGRSVDGPSSRAEAQSAVYHIWGELKSSTNPRAFHYTFRPFLNFRWLISTLVITKRDLLCQCQIWFTCEPAARILTDPYLPPSKPMQAQSPAATFVEWTATDFKRCCYGVVR